MHQIKEYRKKPGEAEIRFNYINFGQMPASSVKVRSLMSEIEITKDELVQKATGQDRASPVFPGEEKAYFMRYSYGGSNTLIQTKGKPPYIGFLISYDYGNKHGRYGVIIELDLNKDIDTIVDEWAE